jgi:hypothetical protein
VILTLRFEPVKETKGTYKFEEVVDGMAEAKIGSLYVRKTALGELAFEQGRTLLVTVQVADEAA